MLALLLLTACGSFEPSNLEDIKSAVWSTVSNAEQDYGYLTTHFASRDEIEARCGESRGGCYDPGSLSLWVWHYLPNCGPVLARELVHYVLHVTMGRPDEGHSLKPIWEDESLDEYECEQ